MSATLGPARPVPRWLAWLPARWRGDTARRLAGDATWVAIESAGARGLQLLAMGMAARILGPQAFGEVGVLLTLVVAVTAVLGDALRFTAATQVAALLPRGEAAAVPLLRLLFGATLSMATVCAALVAACAAPLAAGMLGAPALEDGLRIAAVMLWLECVGGVAIGALQGLRAFRASAALALAIGVVSMVAVPLAAQLGGADGVMLALALGAALGCGARVLLLVTRLRAGGGELLRRAGAADFSVLRRVALPGMVNGLMSAPFNGLAMALLVNQPGGYEQAGWLGACNQWFSVLLFVPGVLATVTLPWLAEALSRADPARLRHALATALRTTLLAVAPAALLVAVAAPAILAFYGPGYAAAETLLVLTAATATLASTLNLLSNLLAAAGRMQPVLYAQAAWCVVYAGGTTLGMSWTAGALAVAGALFAATLTKLAVSAVAAAALLRRDRPSGH